MEEAHSAGEPWATDSATVNYVSLTKSETALESTYVDNDESDDDAIPTSYTTTVNNTTTDHHLPDSYTEAMTRSDLWQDPIKKELDVMHEREVWKVIDPPANARLVKTQWTFANKYDGDGVLVTQRPDLSPKDSHKSQEWTFTSPTHPSCGTSHYT